MFTRYVHLKLGLDVSISNVIGQPVFALTDIIVKKY